MWALARALSVPVEEVAHLVDFPQEFLVWKDRRTLVDTSTACTLYRIALALHQLYAVMPSRSVAASWLKSPRRELGGNVPIRLLLTQPGADAVFAAIGRIVATPSVPRNEEPEADSEESDSDREAAL